MKNKRSRPAVKKGADFDPILRQRAAEFLAGPVPGELQPHYLADSLAERVIAACAENVAVDRELLELAELAVGEYDGLIAEARTEELRNYWAASRQLLTEIAATCP